MQKYSKLESIKGYPNYYKNPESGKIYFKKRISGRLRQIATGETGILKAKKVVEERLDDLSFLSKRQVLKVRGIKDPFVCDLWDSFFKFKINQGVSEATKKKYSVAWRHGIKPFFEDHQLSDLNPHFINAYEAWYLKTHPSRIFFTTRKALMSFLKFLFDNELLPKPLSVKNLDDVIKGNIRHEKVGRVYTPKEIQKLLTNSDLRARVAIAFGYYLGLRKREILELKRNDVDLENRVVRIWSFKNKKYRVLPLPDIMMDDLMLFTMKKREYLYESIVKGDVVPMRSQVFDNIWFEAKKAAKIKDYNQALKARFHDLRHSCASRMAETGMPSSVACSVLDMSLKIFDKVYVHISEDKKREWINNISVSSKFQQKGGS